LERDASSARAVADASGRASLRWIASTPHLPLVVELVALVALVAVSAPEARIAPVLALALRAMRSDPRRISPPPLHGVRTLARDLSVAGVAAAPLLGAAGIARHGVTWAGVVAAFVAARVASNLAVRGLRARGLVDEHVLVVGQHRRAHEIRDLLERHPAYGLRPVVHDGPVTPDTLIRSAADAEATRVILIERGLDPRDVRAIVGHGIGPTAQLHILVEGALGLAVDASRADDIWGYTVVAAPLPHDQRPPWILKRVTERSIAAATLLVLTPVLGLVALGVRVTSPGPILFRQVRVGRLGRPFTMLKFRSLPVDHRDTGWNAGEDVRPTAFGAFLRASSLDELPQLINVMRGEMSLVGPRPELPHYVDEFSLTVPGYDLRHRLPVGLTGWAQAHGLRGKTSLEERIRFDNAYIDRWTLSLELSAVLRTVWHQVRRKPRPARPESAPTLVAPRSVGPTAPPQVASPRAEVVIDLRDAASVRP
jgi:lipopolysaccharide/colanic/teichoic acid biosynthesis glycosyltransferase